MTDQDLPGDQSRRPGAPATRRSRPAGRLRLRQRVGRLPGDLAMAVLKAERVLFLSSTPTATCEGAHPSGAAKCGRIRTVVDGPGPTTYVTTDNGGGDDSILAVHPGASSRTASSSPGTRRRPGRHEPEDPREDRQPQQPARVRRPPGARHQQQGRPDTSSSTTAHHGATSALAA